MFDLPIGAEVITEPRIRREILDTLRRNGHAVSRLAADELERLWTMLDARTFGDADQINRIMVGLIHEYGWKGKLLLSDDSFLPIPSGVCFRWCCTGVPGDDYVTIWEHK